MKKIIYLLAITLSFIGCRSEDSSSTNNSTTPVLVTKVITSTSTDSYIYDGTKLKSIISSQGGAATITYDGELIKKFEYKKNGNITYTIDYNYVNGKISSQKNTQYLSGTIQDFTFNHVNSSQINYTCLITDISTGTMDTATGEIFLNNGNITKRNYSWPSTTWGNGTQTYTYDSKNSPYKNIKGFDKLIWHFSDESGLNNNILETNSTNNDNSGGKFIYTYIYNDKNYPTKTTYNSYNQQNQLLGSGVTNYEYNQ